MSSLRNAIQRRNHKERAQPTERSKWGLLEKHRDYSLRAADHNEKKRKLRALQQKARERNEDEFYFGMVSHAPKGGVRSTSRGEENSGSQPGAGKRLDMETVKLMKTQDEGYLRTVLGATKKLRERVEREVVEAEVGVGVAVPVGEARRKVFDEGGEEVVQEIKNGLDGYDDDLEGLLEDESEDEEREEEEEAQANEDDAEGLTPDELKAKRKKQHTIEVKRRQLQRLKDRERQLGIALREVEEQRARMNGTAGGVNKNGVKFKSRQRRR